MSTRHRYSRLCNREPNKTRRDSFIVGNCWIVFSKFCCQVFVTNVIRYLLTYKVISEVDISSLFKTCFDFRQLVEDTLEGKFLSTSGFDGWILTSLCSAMTNTSFKEAITQSFLIGLFRFGTWFTVKNFYRIIHNCHRKRNEGKKKA